MMRQGIDGLHIRTEISVHPGLHGFKVGPYIVQKGDGRGGCGSLGGRGNSIGRYAHGFLSGTAGWGLTPRWMQTVPKLRSCTSMALNLEAHMISVSFSRDTNSFMDS